MRGTKTKRRKVRRVCCVPSCSNTNDLKIPGAKFYVGKYVHFPINEERRKKWIKSLGLTFKPNNGHYVCGEHFEDDAWNKQDVLLNIPVTERKLKNGAVPVLVKSRNSKPEEKEQEYSLDVETRKRLVAEALASYEQDYNKVATDTSTTHPTPRNGKRKYNISRSLSTCSDTSLESTLDFMLKDDESDTEGILEEVKSINVPVTVVEDNCGLNVECSENYPPKIEYELIDETTIQKEYKKFGEIMMDMNDMSYALNCSYCENIFFEMFEFKSHVLEQHKNLLKLCEDIKDNAEVIMVRVTEETIDPNEEKEIEETKPYVFLNTHCKIENENQQENGNGNVTNNSDTKSGLLFEEEQIFECPETELLFIEETDQQLFIDEENNEERKLNENDIIELVISLWKKYEVLWDKSHPDFNKTRVQKQTFELMLNEYNTIAPLKSMDLEKLKSMLSDLARAYHEDLHSYRNLSKYRKRDFKPKYWFFYKLNFLNEKFSYLRNVDDELKIASHLSVDISTRQKELALFEIIELYEAAKSLWHVTDPAYEGKLANKTSLKDLYSKLKEKNIHVYLRSENELSELLKSITRWFSAVEYLKHTAKFEEKSESKSAASTFVCGYQTVYDSLTFLQNHVAPYKCSVCQQVYFSEYTYLKHIRSKKNNCNIVMEGGAHKCEYCQKRFKRLCELRCHVRLHTNERPYECKICFKRFRNYATWYRHKRTHTTVKPHECNYCKRKYHCKNLLDAHLKTHLDIRDHVCDICGKSFTWSRYLNRHRVTHLTERNFPCPECGNRFKSKDLLNAHLRRCRQRRLKQQENDVDFLVDFDDSTSMIMEDDSNGSISHHVNRNVKNNIQNYDEISVSSICTEDDSELDAMEWIES